MSCRVHRFNQHLFSTNGPKETFIKKKYFEKSGADRGCRSVGNEYLEDVRQVSELFVILSFHFFSLVLASSL